MTPPAPAYGSRDAVAPEDAPTEDGRADSARTEAGSGGPLPDGPMLSRVVLVATWLVVALGSVLRLRQWSTGRAFWLDELLLLRAMSEQRFVQLLEPLGFAQSAPPGWLAVQHVVVGLSDSDERAGRLVPLLFGVGGLVLAALLARTLLSGPAALVATAIPAVSPQLVTYSSEFKQYSADVFWVLLVLLVGCRLALARGGTARGRLVLAAVAAVAVWFSHAATLVTLGVLAALGVLAVVRRRPRDLLVLAGCAVPFAAGLAVEYAVLLRENTDNGVLRDYWADAFPPPGPLTVGGALDWFAGRTVALAQNPLRLEQSWVLLALLLVGLLVLGLRRPPALLVLMLPLAVVVAAGLAGSYPIGGRLALFLIPVVALALAAPLDLPVLAARVAGRTAPIPATATAGLLAVAAAVGLVGLVRPQTEITWNRIAEPREQEESRTVLAVVAAQRRPGDLVLVDGRGARHAAAFYGPRLGVGPFQLLEPAASTAACLRVPLGARLREEGRYDRIWLVSSHTRDADLQLYRAHLDQFGPAAGTVPATGAAVTRFDRSDAPMPPPDPPALDCLRIGDPAAPP